MDWRSLEKYLSVQVLARVGYLSRTWQLINLVEVGKLEIPATKKCYSSAWNTYQSFLVANIVSNEFSEAQADSEKTQYR